MIPGFQQAFVHQAPKFERMPRRKQRRENQVLSRKSGLIRPDKRRKVKYL